MFRRACFISDVFYLRTLSLEVAYPRCCLSQLAISDASCSGSIGPKSCIGFMS